MESRARRGPGGPLPVRTLSSPYMPPGSAWDADGKVPAAALAGTQLLVRDRPPQPISSTGTEPVRDTRTSLPRHASTIDAKEMDEEEEGRTFVTHDADRGNELLLADVWSVKGGRALTAGWR